MSLLLDETAGDLPVKDVGLRTDVLAAIHDVTAHHGKPSFLKIKDLDVRSRQHVSNVSREELEERFLHLHEEHLLLKQHARRQEDKIKRMATKLLRLTNERKHGADGSGRRGRDLEAEEMIEELQDKVRELEHQNEGLRNKLSVTRQQLQVQGCRQSPYGHVQSRINTGLRRVTEAIQLQEKLRKDVFCKDVKCFTPRSLGLNMAQE
ncbi:protein fantom-like [Latimeria chalumnae]|uniref:protein fantom-like n=1 Tax=Latimeria chalumnae TaxID=7897 RepID=UPI00313CF062